MWSGGLMGRAIPVESPVRKKQIENVQLLCLSEGSHDFADCLRLVNSLDRPGTKLFALSHNYDQFMDK